MNSTDKKYVLGVFSLSAQRHLYYNDSIPFPYLTEDPTKGKAMTFDEMVDTLTPNDETVVNYMRNWGKLHIVKSK